MSYEYDRTRNPGAAILPEVVDVRLEPLAPEGKPRAIVGVIDTGVVSIDGPHKRISACLDDDSRCAENLDTLPPDGRMTMPDGHGTFVIGRILQETSNVLVKSRRGVDTDN